MSPSPRRLQKQGMCPRSQFDCVAFIVAGDRSKLVSINDFGEAFQSRNRCVRCGLAPTDEVLGEASMRRPPNSGVLWAVL